MLIDFIFIVLSCRLYCGIQNTWKMEIRAHNILEQSLSEVSQVCYINPHVHYADVISALPARALTAQSWHSQQPVADLKTKTIELPFAPSIMTRKDGVRVVSTSGTGSGASHSNPCRRFMPNSRCQGPAIRYDTLHP